MLTNFFRSDRPIVIVVLFFAFLVGWVIAFFLGENTTGLIGFGSMESVINKINSVVILGSFLAFIFHFSTAALLNAVVNRFGLSDKKSYAVAFIYLLLTVSTKDGILLTTACVVNLLVVLLLVRLFQLPQSNSVKSIIFDVSGLIGILTIIHSANVFLLLVVWVGIISFKSVQFRDWIISLIGFFTPVLYLVVGLYFFDSLHLMDKLKLIVRLTSISEPQYIIVLGISLLLVPSLFVLLMSYSQKAAANRKMLNLTLLLFTILLVNSVFFYGEGFFLLSILVPISIIIGGFITKVKKVIIAESLLILFMAVIGYYYYLN